METNDNETVEQIHDELKQDPLAPNGAKPWTHYLADRILAAHKRKLAERDGERKGLLKANESLAADNTRLRGEVAAKDAKIATLSSLVKELAVVAERYVSCPATECKTVCGGDEKCIHKKTNALIAKAREVCK